MCRIGRPVAAADRVLDLVRGVGRQQQASAPDALSLLAASITTFGHAVPVARLLHRGDRRQVEAFDRQPRAVQPAEALGHAAIDMLVI